ncbi:acyltransferase family protein [Salmonella enterica]|uniref:acyltransferase family protein n=1 Tax=Salmonella enterica TaxID=28901 RepID=UPI0037322FD6
MRNIGLDIARSIAIVMVLISHSRMFFTQYADVQWLSFNGFFGVEVFFVLSGFLIGRIIIKSVVEKPSFSNLLTFYKRRWYRTLPLYFLMVFVLFLVGKQFHWTNLIFLQNFDEVSLGFFPVSWSLSIEEWFFPSKF